MSKIFIYHNPRWGKSRESVKILDNAKKEYEIIDYMNNPPTPDELQNLSDQMGIPARDFIRSKDSLFNELDLSQYLNNDSILFQHMSQNPRLIERPIIVQGNKAVLGRPPEKVKEFLRL